MRQGRGGRIAVAVACILLAGTAGCKPSPAVKQAQVIGNGTAPASDRPAVARPLNAPESRTTLGMVSGTVRFAGTPPPRVAIDMSVDPVCAATGGENLSEQYVLHDGKLANVYVYVKNGPAAAMGTVEPTPPPVVMDQVGCRYVPHVVALVQGGSVEFRNSDGTTHNVHTMPVVVGDQAINFSQAAKGTPVTKTFSKPETMIPVRCDFHPWMNAFINVSATPFFAVTDAAGHFDINGLPPGRYTLAAIHERLGEQDVTVNVEPEKTAKAEFRFGAK